MMSTSKVKELIAMNELTLHDDYEAFASYLGIEYDDYVELLSDCESTEEEYEIEYSVNY